MTKNEVTNKLKSSIKSFSETIIATPETIFFEGKDGKWSSAEQTRHLMLSVRPLLLAYALPKWVLKLAFGKPNRPTYTYDVLFQKYKVKLEAGGTASAPYQPKPFNATDTPETINLAFLAMHQNFIKKVEHWDDRALNNYLLPHPLLGKITLLEMLYFTDFHIRHHEALIKQYYQNTN